MLRFIDSFDHYATADTLQKYTSQAGSTAPAITTGRFGSGMNIRDGNTPAFLQKTFPAVKTTWVIGFALNIVAFSGTDKILAQLFDTATGQTQWGLYYQNSTQKLYLAGAWGSSVGSTVLTAGVWYYVEVKIVIHNSTGSYEWRINGNTEGSASGIDTLTGAATGADAFRMQAGNSSVTSQDRRFDDLYICDGDAGGGSNPCNDFLGDCRIECLFPNGNGATSQLVGQDGNSTDNYLNVDETTPDDDTTYNQSNTLTQKDTYAYTNLVTTSGTVFGVQTCMHARKDDAGTRQIKAVSRESGGTEEDGPAQTLSTSYLYYCDIFDTDPDAVDWTISSVNAGEWGMKVFA